jgi:hypothetical protein
MDLTSSRAAGITAAALLTGIAGFQAALAAGAPWGVLAYGGATAGTLPEALRTSSALVVPVYLGLAAVAAGAVGSPRARLALTRAGAVLMTVGAVVNLASPSLPERLLWVPVTAATAVALWRAAPAVDGPERLGRGRVAGSPG